MRLHSEHLPRLYVLHLRTECLEVEVAQYHIVSLPLLLLIELVHISYQCTNYYFNEREITDKVKPKVWFKDAKGANGVPTGRTGLLHFSGIVEDARVAEGVETLLQTHGV